MSILVMKSIFTAESRHEKTRPLSIQKPIAPLGKESISKRLKAGSRARGRRVRMTGAGNQEDAETVGLGESIIIVAQPWPELPAQMEGFLDLNF